MSIFRILMMITAVLGLAAQPVTGICAEPAAPTPLTPLLSNKPQPKPKPKPPLSALPAGIEATPLSPLDPTWGNALPAGATPLPPQMWQGTSRAVVRAVLPLLSPTRSPAIDALTRRLLLSGATAPAGTDPAAGPSLLLLRAKRLYDLGMVPGALAVLRLVPPDRRSEAMARLRVELAVTEGDVAGACQRVDAAIMGYREVWWDRVQIACQLLNGDRAKAKVALEVLRDRNVPAAPTFDRLVAAAEGHPVTLPKSARLSPLGATLWAMSKRPLPEAVIAGAAPATLIAFADNDTEPAGNRLGAAERAAALGAWSPKRLAALYGKVKIDKPARAKLLAETRLGDTPRGRAILFDAARQAHDPGVKAEILRRLLDAARRHDLTFVAARLTAPLILAMKPQKAMKPVALAFIRALVTTDRPQAIAPWLPLADPAEIGPLATLVRIIEGTTPPPTAAAIQGALKLLAARKGRAARDQTEMFLMLAAAFGTHATPPELVAALVPARHGTVPSLALWLDQRNAAVAHCLGETLLTSLAMATTTDHHLTLEPVVLARVVAGIRAAGLDHAAQRIALEAAIAVGM
ncbi:MAG: hypothetical protein ACREFD_00430 [Stellaceae bacterium]